MSWRTWVFLGLFRWKQELRSKLSKPPNHMARLVQISQAFKQPLPGKCCWEFGKPMTLDSCTKLGIKGKTTRPKQEAWNKEVTLKTKQSTSIWTVFRWMSTFKSPNCFSLALFYGLFRTDLFCRSLPFSARQKIGSVWGATFVSFDCLCFTTISNFGFIHAFNGYV